MDITPSAPKGYNVVESYSDSGFTISENNISGSIIILPTAMLEITFDHKEIIKEEILLPLLSKDLLKGIEVLLIGTGKKHIAIKPDIRQKIKNTLPLTSVNEMTTSAACRTFNILTLEDRKVAAILTV